MDINITGRHLELTDALKDAVKVKLGRINAASLRSVDVVLSVDKLDHKASVILHFHGAEQMSLDSTKRDMYAALDDLCDKIDRQIEKQKYRQ